MTQWHQGAQLYWMSLGGKASGTATPAGARNPNLDTARRRAVPEECRRREPWKEECCCQTAGQRQARMQPLDDVPATSLGTQPPADSRFSGRSDHHSATGPSSPPTAITAKAAFQPDVAPIPPPK